MTIIEPNKQQGVSRLFWTTVLLLLVVTGWSIAVYNETVALQHTLRAREGRYKEVVAKNGELKNQRFAATDGRSLRAVAEGRGLTRVRTPVYLEARNL